jgi:serine/threonine-protein kinase RsbW
MPSFNRELVVSGTTADLPAISAFVEESCDGAGVDPTLQFDLQLAVEEACCNVIEHAYEGKGGEFSVAFAACGPDVAISLRDHGRPFAPEQVAPPDVNVPLAKRRIGGFGLHLMYRLMDSVRFTFTESGNTLVMIKRGAARDGLSDAVVGGEEGHA